MIDFLLTACINNFDVFAFALEIIMFVFGIWLGLFIGYYWGANKYAKKK